MFASCKICTPFKMCISCIHPEEDIHTRYFYPPTEYLTISYLKNEVTILNTCKAFATADCHKGTPKRCKWLRHYIEEVDSAIEQAFDTLGSSYY